MGFPKLRKEFQQSVHWCFMGLGTQLFANPTVLKKKNQPNLSTNASETFSILLSASFSGTRFCCLFAVQKVWSPFSGLIGCGSAPGTVSHVELLFVTAPALESSE